MGDKFLKNNNDLQLAKLLFNKGTDDALSFNCLIKKIDDDYVEFIGVSDYSEQVSLGALVDIRIYSADGVIYSSATLLRITKIKDKPVYMTTYPERYDQTQKRQYYRADLHLPITLLTVLNNGSVKQTNATTKNISGRGMCFISLDAKFPDFYSITVNIKFPNRAIVTTAEHVYTNPVTYKGSILYIHAFKFLKIEPEEINYIVKECFLYQLESKREQMKK